MDEEIETPTMIFNKNQTALKTTTNSGSVKR